MDEYLIKKLTEEKCIIELHGKDEVIWFNKICREHNVNTDPLIKFCKEIKAQDKIYAMQVHVITTRTCYDVVSFYHESYYNKKPLGNIIRFNNNPINHQNDLISWIK